MHRFHTHIPMCLLAALLSAASTAALAAESAPATPKKEEPAKAPQFALEEGSAGSFLSSYFARQSGDVDAAITYLSSALAKNPTNASLASQLLAMQVVKGDMPAALTTARTLDKNGARDALSDLLLVIEMVKKENYAAASKKLASDFDTANGQLWLPLVDAWIDVGKGSMKQALTLEEMPVTVGRAAAVMNYHLALINAQAGFKEQAATNFTDAVDDAESAPIRVMQQLAAFAAKNKTPALKTLVDQYEAANGPLQPLESPIKTPADGVAEVLYTMGNVMQIAGVANDAAMYLQLTRYLRPDFALASYTLAETLSDAKAYARAGEVLKTVPATSQLGMKATLRQAIILDRMGKANDAIALLAGLAERNPKAIEPWIAKGDLLRVHDRFLEALIAYGEAIKRVKEGSPNNWAVYYARGACYERLDRWSEAKLDLQKALELSPDQPDVLNYLGYGMLVRGENVKEARAMLEKAIAGSPNDAQIIDSMGWALYLTGEYASALTYLERAVELLPSDATVNDHLGDAYWRLGRKTEARYQWRRALTFSPTEEEIRTINAKLASGLPEAKVGNGKSVAAGTSSTAIQ